MFFRVLEPGGVVVDGRPVAIARRRERQLLTVLVLHANRPVSPDRLIQLLWDADPPDSARRQLQGHVARLRSLLRTHGAERFGVDLTRQPAGYVLHCAEQLIDACRFRGVVEQARTADSDEKRVAALGRALRMWPGASASADEEMHDRVFGELLALRAAAREDWIVGSLRLGRHRELLPELERMTAARPTDERLAELHLQALHRSGRRADAVQVYQRVRAALADELGLDPGPGLQEVYCAILRGGDDAGAPAAPAADRQPTAPVTAIVPAELPSRPTWFVGRVDEIAALDAAVRLEAPRAAVLTGAAGIGKTGLAVEWATRNAARFPDGQLFMDLRGYGTDKPLDPAAVLERFLAELGGPLPGRPSLPGLAARLRSIMATRAILVVIDNAGSLDQVRPFLPGGGPSFTLVTTRHYPDSLVATGEAAVVTVPPLNRQHAAMLLRRVGGAAAGAAREADLLRLADLCDRFPLALRIVGVQLAGRRSPGALIRELSDESRRLRQLTTVDGRLAVRAATAATYRRLDATTREMFRALGLLPGSRSVAGAFAALTGTPLHQARGALDALARHNLVVPVDDDRYAVYDLVRLYARAQADRDDPADVREEGQARLLDWYIGTARAADALLRPLAKPVVGAAVARSPQAHPLADAAAALAWCDTVADGLTAALYQWWARHPHRCWTLALHLSGWLERQASYTTWITVMRTAVRAARLDGSVAGHAAALNGLAVAYAYRRQADTAIPAFRRARQLWASIGERERAAYAGMQIGCVHSDTGNADLAVEIQEQAVAELGALPGAGASTNTARFNLGFAYRKAGRLAEAMRLYREVIEQARADGDLRLMCNGYANLATACRVAGDDAAALDSFKSGLELARELRDRTYEAWAVHGLGDISRDGGAVEQARGYWLAALEIYEQLDSPDAAVVREALAATSR